MSFLNAYFEAISGFTSTGFTIFENIKDIMKKAGLPKTMFDRLGVVDTFGQGSGTEHLQKS